MLRQPVLLATYSHQPDRSIMHDDSSMAYYRRAPIGADLTYAFERQVERDEEVEEHLDGLCYALMKLEKEGKSAERRGGVITWRGMTTRCGQAVRIVDLMLTCCRLMTAPFERDGWEMTALALDGSVYLELHEPPEQRRQKWGLGRRVCRCQLTSGQEERAVSMGGQHIHGICVRELLDRS